MNIILVCTSNSLCRTFMHHMHYLEPTHVCAALPGADSRSYRKNIYPSYKAKRIEPPSEIKWQLENAQSFCNAIGIKPLFANNFEADDVIYTYVRQALQSRDNENSNVFERVDIVSSDKDLFTLLDSNRVFIHHGQLETEVVGNPMNISDPSIDVIPMKKFQVRPSQMQDFMALAGDVTDNIAGCPGIGAKRAKLLLDAYGNLDEIFRNIENIENEKGLLGENIANKLKENREMIEKGRQVIELNDISQNNPGFVPLEKCRIDLETFYDECDREWFADNDMIDIKLEIQQSLKELRSDAK